MIQGTNSAPLSCSIDVCVRVCCPKYHSSCNHSETPGSSNSPLFRLCYHRSFKLHIFVTKLIAQKIMSFGAGDSYGPYSSREMHKFVRYGVDKKDGARTVEKPSFVSFGTKERPEPYRAGKVKLMQRLDTPPSRFCRYLLTQFSIVSPLFWVERAPRPLEVQALEVAAPPHQRG